MGKKPLVSIVIPTFNSEKTLPLTLESIKKQTYRNIEVIIVDSYSTDNTIRIAQKYNARIIKTKGALLWARYIGHTYAKGEIELLLDSDQILAKNAIQKSVEVLQKGYDMAILEEISYKPKTLIQWLFYFDRKHLHKIRDLHPIHGVLLARLYRYDVLDKAFKLIRQRLPLEVMYRLVSQDHALIYYEAWRAVKDPRIAIIRNSLYHIEPSSLKTLVKKFYRYGRTELNVSDYYPELIRGKRTPRKLTPSPESIISLSLWILKAIPYFAGTVSRKLTRR